MRIEGGIPSIPFDFVGSSAKRASNTSESEISILLRVEVGVGRSFTCVWLGGVREKVELKKVLKSEA